MDFSFKFFILLNLNKGIDLKKVHKLEKSTPAAWHALLIFFLKEKNLLGFFSWALMVKPIARQVWAWHE